ncbi:MAG TPA: CHAD domain-containing protein [Ferruginibacter sp.]|nr:CHAD domain-containing protein [Ferruginibacter sp.]
MSFLSGYITRRFAAIKQNLYGFAETKKQEHIHFLRVDIKKLRAVLAFLGKMNGKKKYSGKVLRKLFNDAGILRENYINRSLFKTVSCSGRLLTALSENENLAETEFIDKMPGYRAAVERTEKKLRLSGHKPKKKELKKYFISKASNAENLINDRTDKKNIHRFRISIKKMTYVYYALPARLQKSTGLDADYLDKLQILAGRWHDRYMAVRFLERNKLGSAIYIDKLKLQENRQLNLLVKACKNFRQKIITEN